MNLISISARKRYLIFANTELYDVYCVHVADKWPWDMGSTLWWHFWQSIRGWYELLWKGAKITTHACDLSISIHPMGIELTQNRFVSVVLYSSGQRDIYTSYDRWCAYGIKDDIKYHFNTYRFDSLVHVNSRWILICFVHIHWLYDRSSCICPVWYDVAYIMVARIQTYITPH